VADVLLVNAGWGALFSGKVKRYNRRFPPLDLLNCAALLRNAGHRVSLIDGRAGDGRDLGQAASRADHIMVTLSSLDRWQCPNTDLDQVDRFLEPFPSDRLTLMGAQVTVRPELLLQRTGALGAILGEPEGAVIGLADGGAHGEIAGTAALQGAELVKTENQPLDLTDLPTPAFDLIDFNHYRYEVLGGRMGLLELTRGCPWRCRFCLLAMYGKKYRRKTPAQLVEEVRVAWSQGMRCAYFQDLEFTLDHELVAATCEALKRSGLPLRWGCQTRPDTIDRPLLQLMREAGCEVIHYGVESGVPRVVKTTDKRQSLDAVETGVRLAREVGMNSLCYFLIGLPGETPDEMYRTFEFARRVGPTWASFQVATPYPTTRYHDEAEFSEAFPECFDGALSADELRALARRFTAEYHLRPAYIMDRLKGPGRRGALREAGLIARYLWS
jgi:anaerobic magnesium-protoporphyrin IX monomethyl ester cyclase